MAVVAKQKTENKYSHLSKIYNQKEEKIKIEPQVDDEKVEIKVAKESLSRKTVLQNVILAAVLLLLASSGYIATKIF